MLTDGVGGECYLRAGREVFHDIATALPLFRPYSDDEGDLHFIRMAYLVADAFSREVDRDRHVFPPQVLRELYRVPARRGLDNGDHELRRRRVARQKVVRFQKIARGYVAHAESDGGDGLGAEKREEIVVAAAAKERAAGARGGGEDPEHH